MTDARAKHVGAELRKLLDDELADVSLKEWNAKMQDLVKHLEPDVANVVSNTIWSWFTDADVRRKEPGIRARSTEEIRTAIALLERGEWAGLRPDYASAAITARKPSAVRSASA